MTNMLEQEGYAVTDEMRRDLQSGDYKTLKHAEEKLFKWDLKYRERKGRKWITMLIGMLALGITGWFVIPLFNKLNHSLYNRLGLQGVTEEKFGETRISEVLTDDIMIVAYDFRNHKPVIFTKYAATNEKSQDVMNVMIRDAA
jgi:hypothetical protein